MKGIHLLLRGALPAFLILSCGACATKPSVRTETVEVKVPVYVPVPAELTREVAAPVLPAAATNGDLADYADALRAALNAANAKLREIAGLQPKAGE
jgi:hypothetical protein